MRVLSLLVLCLAIGLQSPVQARAAKSPCPMEQSGFPVAADDSMPTQDDCCNDAETVAKTGKLCKTGMECQSSSPCLLVSPSHGYVSEFASQPLLVAERVRPADSPASVWRPPALN
jgi:hypothetical protein